MLNHDNQQEPKAPRDFNFIDVTTDPFVVIGDSPAMQTYKWFEQFEEDCRFRARRIRSDKLRLWQEGLKLMADPFMPGKSHDFSEYEGPLELRSIGYSLEYRMYVAAQAVRTAKVAIDAGLNGYYSQSLALCRRLHESYKRMVYVRVRPREVYRWLADEIIDPSVKELEGFPTLSDQPSGADWRSLFAKPESDHPESSTNEMLLSAAQGHMDYLNSHAHPDLEGATDVMGNNDGVLDRWHLNIAPSFSLEHLDRLIHTNISAIFLLLFEISRLEDRDQRWQSEYQDWLSRFGAMLDADSR